MPLNTEITEIPQKKLEANYFEIVGINIAIPRDGIPVLHVTCCASFKDEEDNITQVRAWTERVPDAAMVELMSAPLQGENLYEAMKNALYDYLQSAGIFPAGE